MSHQPQITRTDTGYQLGNLHTEKLPPRQAEVLLLCASGLSEKSAAKRMACSPKNIANIKAALFFKLRANTTPALITRAFENSYLKFLSLFAAIFFAAIAPTTVDHQKHAGRFVRSRTSQTARNYRSGKNNNLFEAA